MTFDRLLIPEYLIDGKVTEGKCLNFSAVGAKMLDSITVSFKHKHTHLVNEIHHSPPMKLTPLTTPSSSVLSHSLAEYKDSTLVLIRQEKVQLLGTWVFVCLWIKTLLTLDCVAFTQDVSLKHLENVVIPADQNICVGLWLQLRATILQ